MKRLFLLLVAFIFTFALYAQRKNFVTTRGSKFFISGKQYNYIGTNFWYAGLLGATPEGKIRLNKELDFLIANGVDNLRVMAVAEGEGKISGVERVQPAFQSQQGLYDTALLHGLDYLLVELGKRKMKAVIFLSNNWEWSGGFLQYLNWNNLLPDSIMRRRLSWDEQQDYTSKFYSCKPCIDQQHEVLKMIVARTNSISGKKYADDAAIMSWELANEPRPMRPAAYVDYVKWIEETAALIKSIDKNHLVTTGAEGDVGTAGINNFSSIHANKNIDYATIHIWPKNWGWFKDTSINKDMKTVLNNTRDFIRRHVDVARKIDKPLVIEEFGLPRDLQSFELSSSTSNRDHYYSFIFDQLQKSIHERGVIQGVNFWALGGFGRPSYKQPLWQPGEEIIGDPPMEEQGLNSVFNTDSSTWKVIRKYSRTIKRQ